LYKSIVFARENLNTLECRIYKESFDTMIKLIKTPTLLIFLKSKISRLKANIKKRGRNFEKDLKLEYLSGIQKGYAELLKQELPFPVKELDINKLDFQHDKNAFQSILRSVFRASFL
jgi:deoxyadenosine/deoxycytidine kinase